MSDQEPVRIVLTPEQRDLVKRMSGEYVEAIELEADESEKSGGPLRFLWRLSAGSGLPRRAWVTDDATPSDAETGELNG